MNRFYEELSMNAWPSLNTHHYDGWLLRYANKYTKRANSVYPLYSGDVSIEEKVRHCESYYESMDMATTFKLNDSDELKDLDSYLEENAYHVLDPTDVMTLTLSKDMALVGHDYDVEVGYSEKWAKLYGESVFAQTDEQRAKEASVTLKAMLQEIKPTSFYIFLKEEGTVIGIANGVIEQNYLGIYNVIINEAYRGLGNGRKIMEALLAEGMKLGATKSYLQVICDNQVAYNLYKSMGYQKAYTYWYRRQS